MAKVPASTRDCLPEPSTEPSDGRSDDPRIFIDEPPLPSNVVTSRDRKLTWRSALLDSPNAIEICAVYLGKRTVQEFIDWAKASPRGPFLTKFNQIGYRRTYSGSRRAPSRVDIFSHVLCSDPDPILDLARTLPRFAVFRVEDIPTDSYVKSESIALLNWVAALVSLIEQDPITFRETRRLPNKKCLYGTEDVFRAFSFLTAQKKNFTQWHLDDRTRKLDGRSRKTMIGSQGTLRMRWSSRVDPGTPSSHSPPPCLPSLSPEPVLAGQHERAGCTELRSRAATILATCSGEELLPRTRLINLPEHLDHSECPTTPRGMEDTVRIGVTEEKVLSPEDRAAVAEAMMMESENGGAVCRAAGLHSPQNDCVRTIRFELAGRADRKYNWYVHKARARLCEYDFRNNNVFAAAEADISPSMAFFYFCPALARFEGCENAATAVEAVSLRVRGAQDRGLSWLVDTLNPDGYITDFAGKAEHVAQLLCHHAPKLRVLSLILLSHVCERNEKVVVFVNSPITAWLVQQFLDVTGIKATEVSELYTPEENASSCVRFSDAASGYVALVSTYTQLDKPFSLPSTCHVQVQLELPRNAAHIECALELLYRADPIQELRAYRVEHAGSFDDMLATEIGARVVRRLARLLPVRPYSLALSCYRRYLGYPAGFPLDRFAPQASPGGPPDSPTSPPATASGQWTLPSHAQGIALQGQPKLGVTSSDPFGRSSQKRAASATDLTFIPYKSPRLVGFT